MYYKKKYVKGKNFKSKIYTIKLSCIYLHSCHVFIKIVKLQLILIIARKINFLKTIWDFLRLIMYSGKY